MPASLWLVPREDNPFTKTMQELITSTVPSNFAAALEGKDKVNFQPHVTVTSEIDPASTYEKSSPQDWIDSLQLPEFKKEFDEVVLELDEIEAGEPFFKKLTIRLNKDKNLFKLVGNCRRDAVYGGDQGKADQWVENDYLPHLSLMYADMPQKDVKNKVPLVEMQLAYAIGDLFACCGGTLCIGGYLVLVDTSQDVNDWKVIAKRETPWAMWRMTRNLI
jgi:2',3'-cyclic-nucleotide 3'-phosphodiesterase